MNIETVLEKVNKILPPQPAVKFSVEKGNTGIFDNKIGGVPYFPKDMAYPCGTTGVFAGHPMTLLVQLNFEKIPHIPDFPTKGILQFFVSPDDLYGMSAEQSEMAEQKDFRVIYHETILTDETKLLSPDEIPQYTGEEECFMPFKGEYRLIPHEPETVSPTVHDFRFEDAFVKCYNEIADEPIEDFYDLDDEIVEPLYLSVTSFDAVIGGYPVFTQSDPRFDKRFSDCDTLLFELDSVYLPEQDLNILWGDMGTGCFLIPRENLKKLDFSRVLYNYDCG